jgi:hypothetical protein
MFSSPLTLPTEERRIGLLPELTFFISFQKLLLSFNRKPRLGHIRSCYTYLWWLGHIRQFLNDNRIVKLVHAFITSKIDILNSLLIKLPDCKIKRLQRIQNCAARIVTRASSRVHITPVLKQLHWLPITARIDYKILLITYKALNGLSPHYICELLMYKQNARLLRSSDQLLLIEPKMRLSTVGDRAFSSYAPRLWNSLPLHIKICDNVESFKSALKTYLFNIYYEC